MAGIGDVNCARPRPFTSTALAAVVPCGCRVDWPGAVFRGQRTTTLLVRVGRNLELTALAVELAVPVHDCVRQKEELNLWQPFARPRRSFRIAASDYVVVFLLLGPLLRALPEVAPNISVRFFALADRNFEALLLRGQRCA